MKEVHGMQHYFIGIKVSKEIAHLLVELRQEWHLEESHKRLVPAEDLHITLMYLGAVQRDHLSRLLIELEDLAQLIHTFSITLNGVSTFGNPLTPRVVYVGIENEENLRFLQSEIVKKCLKLFLTVDQKTFVPHVTLAKKWNGQQEVFSKKMNIEPKLMTITQFSVFLIHPGKVPSYQAVHTIKLKDFLS